MNHPILLLCWLGVRGRQLSNGHVIDHLLNLLHVVLDCIEALPQVVVLEVEQLKRGIELRHKLGDLQRLVKLPSSHAVHRQA